MDQVQTELHKLIIFSHADGPLVLPAKQPAAAGDQLVFQNATGNRATLLFPPETPVTSEHHPPDQWGWVIIPIDRGAKETLLVRADAEPGGYFYGVWCHNPDIRFRGFAKGNSDPEIIVYG